jgi:hypothetical protein
MMKICRRGASPLLLATVLPISVALADAEGIYIETLNRSAPVVTGEAPIEELSKTYIAYEKMVIINQGADATDMVLDPVAGTITFINHAQKQYLPINVKAVKESMAGPAAEQMRAMMGGATTTVEDTGKTQRIGEWETRQYLVRKTGMMPVEQEIWATEQVDLDVSRYTEMMSLTGPGGLLANTPEDIAERAEMDKVKGYPILTKTKMEMMGTSMETETEVKVIRTEPVAASLFEIPADYKLREMGSGMPMPGGEAHP